ncbi:tryptophan-rich sensory protein [Paenibacillus lemnae]|uniref:Tryptophan-rich sensory protein n=1 Tax=Paenibacillus lemnae TaxID=1330551 RepID=A0A848MA21_PAELE|nr:tryptophan-rich sensory protein [Paenibacillus lemnae]NMO98098.1 tryptophan-rich sensory protein [Paenibacillus lemnae]
MYHKHPYRWWNAAAFAAVITINILSNALPLGGRNTGDISDQFYIYITPAGYAFSIWSLIYVLLAGFVIYQLRRDTSSRDSVRATGIWFILSCIFNMAWLFLWHYLYIEWSVFAMLLLLASIFVLYRKTRGISSPSPGERWLVKLPFSIYLGWVSAAFLVNVGIVIYKNGWSPLGLSELGWSIALLCIGVILAVAISYPPRDGILPLVFVWAYIAIAVEHRDEGTIMLTAFVLGALVFLYALWLMIFKRRQHSYRY